jgi:hypothetical protein
VKDLSEPREASRSLRRIDRAPGSHPLRIPAIEKTMADGKFLGWRFKHKTPLWFPLIVAALMADSVLHFGLLFTVSSWASTTRDASHSHRIPFRDGVNYFVDPALGWYLDARWIGLGLLVLLIVLLVVNRRNLERS